MCANEPLLGRKRKERERERKMAPTAAILIMAVFSTMALSWATDYKNDNERRLDVANRLLALLKSGQMPMDGGPGGTARSAASNGLVPPEAADTVVKNVIELLTGHSAPPQNSLNDKRPGIGESETLRDLNEMLKGSAKTPPPIDLSNKHPSQVVMQYMNAIGITDDNCIKRTICELLVEPQAGYGVFGELVTYVFGSDNPENITLKLIGKDRYNGFHEAAQDGRRMENCAEKYASCKTSYKGYIRIVNLK